MTTWTPEYRARVYAPRSVDPTEATVLTPAAGAPHSDPFQVATIRGLAGYQPYLKLAPGRRGRFDPLTAKLEQGSLTLLFLDARLTAGGANAARWLSAFTGAADGRPQLLGCLVRVEWRPQGTGSWLAYWTGRIKRQILDGLLLVGVELGDMSVDLDAEIAVERPSTAATGVVAPSLLPFGVTAPYGTLPAYNGKHPGRLGGTVKSRGATRYIELDAASRGRADNVLSRRLVDRSRETLGVLGLVSTGRGRFAAGLRLRFSASTPSIAEKEAVPVAFRYTTIDGPAFALEIDLAEVPTADPWYQALTTGAVPDGTVVTFDVREAANPVVLVQASYVQLLADILDGYYWPLLPGGGVAVSVPRESASFTALLADPSVPVGRFPITRTPANKWIEENLLQPGQLGLRFNESGEAVVFSTRLPTSLAGLPVITDTDLRRPAVRWVADSTEVITELEVKGYEEYPIPLPRVQRRDEEFPDLPVGLLAEAEGSSPFPQFGGTHTRNFKPRRHVIQALGLRAMPGETTTGISRSDWIRAEQARIGEALRASHALGVQTLGLACRRTSVTEGLYAGMWALLDVSTGPPNAATNQRGGARLVLVTERNEDGLGIDFEVMDAGPGVLATAPTIGTPAQEAGNTRYGWTAAITLAGGVPALVWVNYTDPSVAVRPAPDDAGWHLAFPIANSGTIDARVKTSATHTFRNGVPGKRAWPRIQTVGGDAGGTAKLPSAFAYPSGTGYVDLAALPAPSSVAVSAVTARSARVSWATGTALEPVVVLLGQAASESGADASVPAVVSPLLPPGSTYYDLDGLHLAGPWYRVQVAHVDAHGNLGPVAGTSPTSFEATGTAAQAPTPASLRVLRQGTTGTGPGQGLPPLLASFFGIELLLTPGPASVGYHAEIYRAPDSGGTPGTWVHVDTIPAENLQGRSRIWRDALPQDGAVRWYKYRLTGPGVSDSADSPVVSAIPGWLPPIALNTEAGEAVLGDTETLVIPAAAFVPESETEDYALLGAYLSPGGVNAALIAYAPVVLPAGVMITAVRMRAYRNDTGDIVQLTLRSAVDGTTSGLSATIDHTGTGWNTDGDSGLSHVVASGEQVYLDLLMNANVGSAVPTEVRLAYAEVDYVRNSYRQ
jgi:hypothetical protein